MRLRAVWWRIFALGLAATAFYWAILIETGIIAIAVFSDGLYTQFDLFQLSLFNILVYSSLIFCLSFLFIAVFAHKLFAKRLLLLLCALYVLSLATTIAVDYNVLGIDDTEYITRPER
ncbi:hypothetical protein PN498_28205 [Oscillatoria sp. CS-180]|uniref:hypothetical protein n=1 Tax=Oscillatoria sp. CS-180 TaxID=3021720 RepID=UPI00232F2788|nr:hypothetical protein [Oscillatoria sp. CS-180]MDB9529902.1 hypothetical protein [Oscillatoria sp. CS-180]